MSAPTIVLRPEDINPWCYLPHGDRLFVEVCEISADVKVGEHTIAVVQNIRDREGKLTEEYQRGFCAGIVITCGNGHVLTTPHQRHVVTMPLIVEEGQDPKDVPNLALYDDNKHYGLFIFDTPAAVPMPWKRGDVVLLERLAKRTLHIGNRTFGEVDQMDVLGTVRNLHYDLMGDGTWFNTLEEYNKMLVGPNGTFAQPAVLHKEPIEDEEIPV